MRFSRKDIVTITTPNGIGKTISVVHQPTQLSVSRNWNYIEQKIPEFELREILVKELEKKVNEQ